MIPIWGSGREAVNDFNNGRHGWAVFNGALAVSDIFLVKAAVTAGGKLLVKGGAKGVAALTARDLAAKEVAQVVPRRAAQGVVVQGTGKYVGKTVDQQAGRLLRSYGKKSDQAQAAALKRLGDLAPNFLYTNGKLIIANAGVFTGGSWSSQFWSTFIKGSWRLGTILNDIKPRNMGQLGKIFDPAYTSGIQ